MLQCPSCGVKRDERFGKCGACDRFWVVPDPEPAPPTPPNLGYRLPALWEATRLCAHGFEKGEHILYDCLHTAEEIKKLRTAPLSRDHRALVETCLLALERMQRFHKSANAADLYGAWRELVPALLELRGSRAPYERDDAPAPRLFTADRIELSGDDE
jgi:hypothetical protein